MSEYEVRFLRVNKDLFTSVYNICCDRFKLIKNEKTINRIVNTNDKVKYVDITEYDNKCNSIKEHCQKKEKNILYL